MESKILFSDIENIQYQKELLIDQLLHNAVGSLNKKIIVLDDDPTGIQTVHDAYVYTDWSEQSIEDAFKDNNALFFILTNSRSFSADKTEKVHKEIALNVLRVSKKLGMDFMIISRGDSTLRGHFPLETNTLKNTIEQNSDIKFDGEIIYPFFEEGGRYTYNDIHYVREGEYLVPAGQTEFAKDNTFGYTQSHLGKWVEEKTNGDYTAKNSVYISTPDIRSMDIDKITDKLLLVRDFNKVIVDSLNYTDVKIFTIALIQALSKKKQFLFRTAASFVKVIGDVSDQALLSSKELIKGSSNNGGLVIIGSHVKKTTEQLEALMQSPNISFLEFNQHLVIDEAAFENEVVRVTEIAQQLVKSGKTTVIYTRRERLDLNLGDKESELKMAVKISGAITSIVKNFKVTPKFIIAKGGITSSDIGTIGLGVKKAQVAGQIKPGIPVWVLGGESKFPGVPYIIFPGNVGGKTTLKEVVEMLDA